MSSTSSGQLEKARHDIPNFHGFVFHHWKQVIDLVGIKMWCVMKALFDCGSAMLQSHVAVCNDLSLDKMVHVVPDALCSPEPFLRNELMHRHETTIVMKMLVWTALHLRIFCHVCSLKCTEDEICNCIEWSLFFNACCAM